MNLAACALILLLTPTVAQTQGEKGEERDAVGRIEKLLGQTGSEGPFSLTSISPGEGKPWGIAGRIWNIGLLDGSTKLTGIVDANGRVRFVSSGPNRPVDPPLLTKNQIDELSKQMLRRIDVDPSQILEDAQLLPSGEVQAIFHTRINGLRIFNLNPLFGYIFRFLPARKKLTYLIDQHEAPSPSLKVPVIDQPEAESIFDTYIQDTHADGYAKSFAAVLNGTTGLRTELGYYKFPKEATARLVWRCSITVTDRFGTRDLKTLDPLVDARTRELIKPNYLDTSR